LNKVIQHWKALWLDNKSLQMPLLVENIVKGNYPQAKPQFRIVKKQAADSEKVVTTQRDDLLKIAEALLLRLYIHCAEYRQNIIDALETQELEFSFSHHRFLWQQMLAIDISLDPKNLISKLQDKAVEFPQEMAQASRLFILDEMAEKDVERAGELIKAAIARMEQIICEKQSRQFLALLEKTDSSIDAEIQQKYYQEFLHYKQRSMELEQQCQVSISDLLQL
ncbi:MAG TPA: DNA primase, partial [Phormidium sp.]